MRPGGTGLGGSCESCFESYTVSVVPNRSQLLHSYLHTQLVPNNEQLIESYQVHCFHQAY